MEKGTSLPFPSPGRHSDNLGVSEHDEGSGDYDNLGGNTCYSKNTNPYLYFSSKTSYFANGIGNKNTDEIQLPGNTKNIMIFSVLNSD